MTGDRVDTLIINGLVITCDSEDTRIKNGWVSITNSNIGAIGNHETEEKPQAEK